MKVFEIKRPAAGDGSYIMHSSIGLDGELETLDIGETVIISCLEMSEAELEKLPEFQGW